jgi:hypothetical protein
MTAEEVDLATHPFDDIASAKQQTQNWSELDRRAGVDEDIIHDHKRRPEYWLG